MKDEKSFFIIFLIVAILLVNILSFWVYENDDAYITYRYSKNLTSGKGPVYNAGEKVEGYTNFLWMVILSLGFLIYPSINISILSKILGTLSALFTIFLMFAISRTLQEQKGKNSELQEKGSDNYLSYISLFLIAVNGCFALNSVSGLETTFFTLLVISGIYFDLCQIKDGKWNWSALFFSLAALTRPEGFLIVLCAFIIKHVILLAFNKKLYKVNLIGDLLIYLFIFIPYFSFKLFFYHDLLPNTFYAKSGGFGSGFLYVLSFFYDYGYFIFFLFIFIPIFFSKRLSSALYLFFILFSYLTGIAIWGGDWMEGYRLIVPVLPIMYLLFQEGVIWFYNNILNLSENMKNREVRIKKIFLVIILLIATKGIIESIPYHFSIYTRTFGYYNSHVKLGNWLKANAKKEDKIALMDIGIIGYMNIDKEIIDITGLTDRTIAHSSGNFLDKRYDLDYIFKKQPKYIVLVSNKEIPVINGRVVVNPLIFWEPIEQRIILNEYFRKNYHLYFTLEHSYPHPTIKYYLNLFVINHLS